MKYIHLLSLLTCFWAQEQAKIMNENKIQYMTNSIMFVSIIFCHYQSTSAIKHTSYSSNCTRTTPVKMGLLTWIKGHVGWLAETAGSMKCHCKVGRLPKGWEEWGEGGAWTLSMSCDQSNCLSSSTWLSSVLTPRYNKFTAPSLPSVLPHSFFHPLSLSLSFSFSITFSHCPLAKWESRSFFFFTRWNEISKCQLGEIKKTICGRSFVVPEPPGVSSFMWVTPEPQRKGCHCRHCRRFNKTTRCKLSAQLAPGCWGR